MTQLEQILDAITPPDEAARARCIRRWDGLCKPIGGFGRLEGLVAQLAAIQGTEEVREAPAAVVILAADNGVVAEGVSQTGSGVSAQVLRNMARGLSSVCVMSRFCSADVIAVDMGLLEEIPDPFVRCRAVRRGTGNIRTGPAMEREEAVQTILRGAALAKELQEQGYALLLAGEMGIGNTTTSAACACALLGMRAERAAGTGAGLDAAGLKRKCAVIRDALACNRPDPEDAVDILQKVGGLDIAGLCGLYLGAAACRIPVVIDGVIGQVAACLAQLLCPGVTAYLLPSHRSAEPAGEQLLARLGMEPVLDAGMHLGEGTGAAALYTLLCQILQVYRELPSFQEGKVEAYQRFDG